MCRCGGPQVSEAELMAEYALRVDRVWDITQWWASVTFGVLLAAHVGASTLNKLIVGIMLLLYTLFTVLAFQIIYTNGDAQVAANLALRAMENDLSIVGKRQVATTGTDIVLTMSVTWLLTFVSTVVYVIYCYKNGSSDGST